MALSTEFSTKGATPNIFGSSPSGPSPLSNFISASGTNNPTPYGNALQKAGNFQTTSGKNVSAPMPPLSAFSSLGAKSQAPATPSTPVKKVTTNNVDGSSNTTEFHTPANPGILPAQNKKTGSKENAIQQPPNYPGLVSSVVGASKPNSTQTGLISNLSNTATGNADIGNKAAQIAEGYGKKIAEVGNLGAGAVAGDLSTGTNVVGSGNAAIASQSASQRMSALSAAEQAALAGTGQQLTAQGQQANAFTSALGGANTQQSQQLSGLGTAAGLAQPQLAGFNQQAFNPLTSSFAGGNINDAVSQVVQRIQNGQMSYDQGTQALQGYGQGGVNALQQALGPNFNVAQSNALAGQQGTIGPAYNFAKSALSNLQEVVKKLGISQGTNIPIVNAIGNIFSSATGIGSDATRQYQGALAEARNAYAQLLAASRGGTPTDYGNQATAAIPDNATPNDIQAAINNLESLGGAKLQIYGNPGASTVNNNSGTSGGFAEAW